MFNCYTRAAPSSQAPWDGVSEAPCPHDGGIGVIDSDTLLRRMYPNVEPLPLEPQFIENLEAATHNGQWTACDVDKVSSPREGLMEATDDISSSRCTEELANGCVDEAEKSVDSESADARAFDGSLVREGALWGAAAALDPTFEEGARCPGWAGDVSQQVSSVSQLALNSPPASGLEAVDEDGLALRSQDLDLPPAIPESRESLGHPAQLSAEPASQAEADCWVAPVLGKEPCAFYDGPPVLSDSSCWRLSVTEATGSPASRGSSCEESRPLEDATASRALLVAMPIQSPRSSASNLSGITDLPESGREFAAEVPIVSYCEPPSIQYRCTNWRVSPPSSVSSRSGIPDLPESGRELAAELARSPDPLSDALRLPFGRVVPTPLLAHAPNEFKAPPPLPPPAGPTDAANIAGSTADRSHSSVANLGQHSVSPAPSLGKPPPAACVKPPPPPLPSTAAPHTVAVAAGKAPPPGFRKVPVVKAPPPGFETGRRVPTGLCSGAAPMISPAGVRLPVKAAPAALTAKATSTPAPQTTVPSALSQQPATPEPPWNSRSCLGDFPPPCKAPQKVVPAMEELPMKRSPPTLGTTPAKILQKAPPTKLPPEPLPSEARPPPIKAAPQMPWERGVPAIVSRNIQTGACPPIRPPAGDASLDGKASRFSIGSSPGSLDSRANSPAQSDDSPPLPLGPPPKATAAALDFGPMGPVQELRRMQQTCPFKQPPLGPGERRAAAPLPKKAPPPPPPDSPEHSPKIGSHLDSPAVLPQLGGSLCGRPVFSAPCERPSVDGGEGGEDILTTCRAPVPKKAPPPLPTRGDW